jgi:hypothetical protein
MVILETHQNRSSQSIRYEYGFVRYRYRGRRWLCDEEKENHQKKETKVLTSDRAGMAM